MNTFVMGLFSLTQQQKAVAMAVMFACAQATVKQCSEALGSTFTVNNVINDYTVDCCRESQI